MIQIDIIYEGNLRTWAIHRPSGITLETDAPQDNLGEGSRFSPTDLLATALGSCALTTMGIAAHRHGWNLETARARVRKHMTSDPLRRVGCLELDIGLPAGIDPEARAVLERAAETCPVRASLAPEVEVRMRFRYGAE